MSDATIAKELGHTAELDALEELLLEVRDHLRRMQRSVNDEIRDYPTPIPRCDAQFNHLLEQRARLRRAVERVDAPADRPASRAERIGLLEEFAASPAYIDTPAEGEIRARIRAALSRLGR